MQKKDRMVIRPKKSSNSIYKKPIKITCEDTESERLSRILGFLKTQFKLPKTWQEKNPVEDEFTFRFKLNNNLKYFSLNKANRLHFNRILSSFELNTLINYFFSFNLIIFIILELKRVREIKERKDQLSAFI